MSVDSGKLELSHAQNQQRLFNVLADYIKQPLLQIAREAELAKLTDGSGDYLEDIESTADHALKLLDNYLLSAKLAAMVDFQLEPVSVAAVLNDSAHQLSKLAGQYGCSLELHLAGKYEPIMAHRAGLEAALTSLGYVFMEAQTTNPRSKPSTIKLAAHRSRAGIVTGMFADIEGLSANVYRRARGLYGLARQPIGQLSASGGAGVFVADSLLASMSARLRVAKHQKLTGLAATFLPSQQMVLV